jgi:hypothetical protein
MSMKRDNKMNDLPARTSRAVAYYWKTREAQHNKQQQTGKADQGSRSAVTGGVQMDGFIELFTDIIQAEGIADQCVFRSKSLELPGFFRPTKEWDILVVRDNILLAAIEAKSQVGPSFGNNFNNRTEEAMGSALDLWTAYREHAYLASPQPFLGYFFMLEYCEAATKPVKVQEPHFKVFPEFVGASYLRRYEIFCRKLVLERHYSAAAFITSSRQEGASGRLTFDSVGRPCRRAFRQSPHRPFESIRIKA